MCEMADAFLEQKVTARVEHTCVECGDAIKRGERYSRQSGVWDHVPESFALCLTCAAWAEALLNAVHDQRLYVCWTYGSLDDALEQFQVELDDRRCEQMRALRFMQVSAGCL